MDTILVSIKLETLESVLRLLREAFHPQVTFCSDVTHMAEEAATFTKGRILQAHDLLKVAANLDDRAHKL